MSHPRASSVQIVTAATALRASFLQLVITTTAILIAPAPSVANTVPDAGAPDSTISIDSFPAEKTAQYSLKISGRSLNYHVTMGTIPIASASGSTTAAVTFLAYTLDSKDGTQRPITFAINGGPGSASANLNAGGLGPRRLVFDPTSAQPPHWIDNEDSWLPFTDLVFIDPVGTGFSRSFLTPEASRNAFYRYDTDIAYLAQSIFHGCSAMDE
jgi:carboxypeptidase C (cathepsin A)